MFNGVFQFYYDVDINKQNWHNVGSSCMKFENIA